jgi:chromate reductase, NAD(P)H dehydrogenase (quinone)
MTTIIGLSGSLRAASFNSGLLRAAKDVTPAGATLQIESIRGIPLYDGDEEAAHGLPPRVAELKETVASADGLLLVTPEYNNAMPGVFKNAIDWLSRPANDVKRVFGGRRVAIIGVTPGGWGTLHAQSSWLPVLRHLGCFLWTEGRMALSKAGDSFEADGTLKDVKTREQLKGFMEGFAAFCAKK